MSTIVEGDFEWDSKKAASNVVKHGVSFAEAATVFADPMAVYLDDGSGTERMVVIGLSCLSRNETVPSPCYTHGEESVDVQAYPS